MQRSTVRSPTVCLVSWTSVTPRNFAHDDAHVGTENSSGEAPSIHVFRPSGADVPDDPSPSTASSRATAASYTRAHSSLFSSPIGSVTHSPWQQSAQRPWSSAIKFGSTQASTVPSAQPSLSGGHKASALQAQADILTTLGAAADAIRSVWDQEATILNSSSAASSPLSVTHMARALKARKQHDGVTLEPTHHPSERAGRRGPSMHHAEKPLSARLQVANRQNGPRREGAPLTRPKRSASPSMHIRCSLSPASRQPRLFGAWKPEVSRQLASKPTTRRSAQRRDSSAVRGQLGGYPPLWASRSAAASRGTHRAPPPSAADTLRKARTLFRRQPHQRHHTGGNNQTNLVQPNEFRQQDDDTDDEKPTQLPDSRQRARLPKEFPPPVPRK